MAKNDKISIEADERKVIDQLLKDSRQSPHEIAKRLGFSRQKVWRIIKKLEKNKVIWGYTAAIGDDRFEKNTYFALITIKTPILPLVKDIISKTKKLEFSKKLGADIICAHYLNGLYDWVVVFSANDIRAAKKICNFIQVSYPEYVERIVLLESVFPLLEFRMLNPNIEKLDEFTVH
jgi:DNA-binding Lrp family transcriptional regulator